MLSTEKSSKFRIKKKKNVFDEIYYHLFSTFPRPVKKYCNSRSFHPDVPFTDWVSGVGGVTEIGSCTQNGKRIRD